MIGASTRTFRAAIRPDSPLTTRLACMRLGDFARPYSATRPEHTAQRASKSHEGIIA